MNCKEQQCLAGMLKRTDFSGKPVALSILKKPFTKMVAICKIHFLSDNQKKRICHKSHNSFTVSPLSFLCEQLSICVWNQLKNRIGLMSNAKQTDLLNGAFPGRKPFGVNWMGGFRLFFIIATCCFATQNMSIYSKYRDVCNKLTSDFWKHRWYFLHFPKGLRLL